MTTIRKGHWGFDGEDAVELTMEFSKVDKENRLVSGFATLDNIDSQDDIVTPEASMKAFARARGNIREQHDEKKAVGRMVKFREGEFYDKETDKIYKGVYVTVRVSKGAQDTWEKVLDGTLSGFSIGGKINEATNEIDKSGNGKKVRIIKDYDLTELSLVDNPANQLASILSIKKSASGVVTVEGPVIDADVETVFYCKNDGSVQPSTEDSVDCFECGEKMEDIGWFEVVGDNKVQKVRDIVNDFVKSDKDETDEGGVTVAKKDTIVKSDDSLETPPESVEEVVAPVEEPAAPVEVVPEEVVEIQDDESNITKKIDDLKDAVLETLADNNEKTSEIVKALENKIETLNDTFKKEISEIDNKLSDFSERLDVAKSQLAEFEKSLEKMDSATAFKKSADVISEETTETKSKWNGAFSVDNLV